MATDFESMSDEQLRAHARKHYSSITRIQERDRLIRAMQFQEQRQERLDALQAGRQCITCGRQLYWADARGAWSHMGLLITDHVAAPIDPDSPHD